MHTDSSGGGGGSWSQELIHNHITNVMLRSWWATLYTFWNSSRPPIDAYPYWLHWFTFHILALGRFGLLLGVDMPLFSSTWLFFNLFWLPTSASCYSFPLLLKYLICISVLSHNSITSSYIIVTLAIQKALCSLTTNVARSGQAHIFKELAAGERGGYCRVYSSDARVTRSWIAHETGYPRCSCCDSGRTFSWNKVRNIGYLKTMQVELHASIVIIYDNCHYHSVVNDRKS